MGDVDGIRDRTGPRRDPVLELRRVGPRGHRKEGKGSTLGRCSSDGRQSVSTLAVTKALLVVTADAEGPRRAQGTGVPESEPVELGCPQGHRRRGGSWFTSGSTPSE